MRLLVLGGTQFVGRHLVERLVGDRAGDLSALDGGRWDAVVDTSGHVPRIVRDSAALLAGRIGHYAFVSSIAVYADRSGPVSEAELLAACHAR